MFTLSLRGRYGFLITLRLHRVLIVMTLVLFSVVNPILQSLVLVAGFACSALVIRQACENKDSLTFNSDASRQYALPSTRRIARALNGFSIALLLFFGVSVFLLLLFGAIPQDEPLGLFVAGFYVGCMAALDIISRHISRHDRIRS